MNCHLIDFTIMGDERGSLIALEEHHNAPFEIKRIYYVFGTKENVRRGYHAHKDLKQIAICVSGSCMFHLDDGKKQQEVLLNTPDQGLLMESMVWHEMYDFSPDCVLLVLANEHYDETDYIRDYEIFLEETQNAS